MSLVSRFYLNLGSNILPGPHLAQAVRLLRTHGDILQISSVWESQALGSAGPNFLNLSVGFHAEMSETELKRTIVRPVETALGRSRNSDKNSPRTIDIDIVLADNRPLNLERWGHPFVILPMAELLPDFVHPVTGRRLAEESSLAAASMWIRRRPDITIK